jgi:hypothetical protein
VEEPTQWELLRSLQRDVQQWITDRAMYVTQEQRESDKRIMDLQYQALAKDQQEDRERLDRLSRNFWTTIAAPVIVGITLYFLLGGKP